MNLGTSSLSCTFAGYVQAARALGDQVTGNMSVTVVVHSVPWLSVRCGTWVARPRRDSIDMGQDLPLA
jgi:hypothetical protein